MSDELPRVLCVDDEVELLAGLRRTLWRQYSIAVASNPADAEAMLVAEGPFAVVVSDLRMPGSDGITFLSRARQFSPNTVRILLTGYADVHTAIAAINDGNIFRFLTKPCAPETLASALASAVRQHELIMAEHSLLEETLKGAVKTLTEILSLTSPAAFGRAMRVRQYVQAMASRGGVACQWEVELAAMLSQIGFVALDSDTVERAYVGQALSAPEREAVAKCPRIGAELLARIPRLERVAEMIACQHDKPADLVRRALPEPMATGCQLLLLGLRFDEAISQGVASADVVAALAHEFPPTLALYIDALAELNATQPTMTVRAVTVEQLSPTMVLMEDVRATSGVLLMAKGQHLTETAIERLHSFVRKVGVREPIRVSQAPPIASPAVQPERGSAPAAHTRGGEAVRGGGRA